MDFGGGLVFIDHCVRGAVLQDLVESGDRRLIVRLHSHHKWLISAVKRGNVLVGLLNEK